MALYLALKGSPVLLIARETINEDLLLAALQHGILQQADSDL